MTALLTYSLEFRGCVSPEGDVLVARAAAPSWIHETRLQDDGVTTRLVFDDSEEAILSAQFTVRPDGSFSAVATVDFGHGHRLFVETDAHGRLTGSADEQLRHGSAILEVVGGTGQFEGATGRITSNFVLSTTGELTDNQLGLLFLRAAAA